MLLHFHCLHCKKLGTCNPQPPGEYYAPCYFCDTEMLFTFSPGKVEVSYDLSLVASTSDPNAFDILLKWINKS